MDPLLTLAQATRMVVHGGQDYKDERPEFFTHGHPILSIELGGKLRHFKATSILARAKAPSLQQQLYQL